MSPAPLATGHAFKRVLVLCLAVTTACSSSTGAMRDDVDPSVEEFSCGVPAEGPSLETTLPLARVEVLAEGGVRLHLPPVGAEPSFQHFTREDARRVLQRFHEDLAGLKRRERWVASAAPVLASMWQPAEARGAAFRGVPRGSFRAPQRSRADVPEQGRLQDRAEKSAQ